MSEEESVNYLPGRFLGVLPSLTKGEYDRFLCPHDDPEAVRRSLADLLPHLGDELIAIERRELTEGGNCRLATFQQRGDGAGEGFVVVTGQGQVFAGRTDTLETGEPLRLGSFESSEHEILSVAVTGSHRLVGNRLDLYLVTRSFQEALEAETAVKVYHGLIDFDAQGMPHLEPAADDTAGGDLFPWRPLDAARMPRWLRSWRLGYTAGVDPIGAALAQPGMPWPYEDPEADPVAVSPDWIGYGRTGELVLRRPWIPERRRDGERRKAERFPLLLGTEIGLLALGRERNGVIRGLTRASTRHLIGFECSDDGAQVRWRQLQPSFAADAVFLDGRTNAEEVAWPDLLVVFQDGTLERLSYRTRMGVRWIWKFLWKNLCFGFTTELGEAKPRGQEQGGKDLELYAKLKEAQNSRGRELSWRRVALFAAVEEVLERLPESSQEDRAGWLEELEKLFAADEDHNLLLSGLYPILQCFRKAAGGKVFGEESSQIMTFATDLLLRIYRQQEYANVEVISRIDWIARSVEWLGAQDALSEETHRQLAELERHSQIHLRDVVRNLAGEERTAQVVRRCSSNIERWSSALTMTDTVWLGRLGKTAGEEAFLLTGVAVFRTVEAERGERRWLAVARRGILNVHALDDGRLELAPTKSFEGTGNLRVVTIPGNAGDRLLVMDGGGCICLLEMVGEELRSSEPFKRRHCKGRLGPMQVLPENGESCLVALTCNDRRQTTLCLLRIERERITQFPTQSLDMHEISCLDLALRDKTVWLQAASALGGVVKFFNISLADGTITKEEKYRPPGGSACLAAHFEHSVDPVRSLVGDRSGFLWCGGFETPTEPGRLRWIFQLGEAVRSICSLEFESDHLVGSEPHFLVGSEAGKVALIRSRDGRRIWTDYMLSPVRHLVGVGEGKDWLGVVAMEGGWVCTFRLETERGRLLDSIKQDLNRLRELQARDDEMHWHTPDAQVVRAFYDLQDRMQRDQAGDLAPVLQGINGRERRARVLRFLVEVTKPRSDEDCGALLAELTFRDLYRLLSYLPDKEARCEEQVVQLLGKKRIFKEPASEEGHSFAMQAQVTALQRLSQRAPTPAQVLAAKPQDLEWLKDRWVSLEMARILMHTLETEGAEAYQELEGRDQEEHEPCLLLRALPYLLQLPESMVEVCADFLLDDGEDAHDFLAFRRLVRDLVEVGRVDLEDLRRLQERFGAQVGEKPVVSLLAAIGALLLSYRNLRDEQNLEEDKPEEVWKDMRQEVLESLNSLIECCGELKSGAAARRSRGREGPEYRLFAGLRKLVTQGQVPPDSQSQKERLAWWSEVHQDIVGDNDPSPASQRPWARPVEACLQSLRKCMQRITEWEIKHIRGEVRPFVEIAGTMEVDTNRRVYLPLRLRYEGRSDLLDVSIRVDAGRRGGLLPPSPTELFKVFHLDEFRGDSAPLEVDFQGYSPAGRQSVKISTEMLSAKGTEHHQDWEFPLPETRQEVQGQGQAGPFRMAVEQALKRTLADNSPVVFAVVDEILGRQTFIQGWGRTTRGHQIDLDGALRDIGRGRTYSERDLSLDLLVEVLRPNKGKEADQPVLVTSTAETIQRLLDGEARGLLGKWMAWLRDRAEQRVESVIVLLVSSTHACFLRSFGLGSISEIRAHQMIVEKRSEHRLPTGEEMKGLVKAVELATGLEERLALQRIDQLGADLFLIARWFLWVAIAPGRGTRGLAELWETRVVKGRLRAELANLRGLDLLVALVGALAETTVPRSRVREGLISARNYQSTTQRHQSKLVQGRGEPFTSKSLHSLDSDARPPERVRIEGFGTLGTASAQGTNLLGLTSSRGESARRRAFERLHQLGIGTWFEGVFRTVDPYRSIIREMYGGLTEQVPLEQRDSEVYRVLLGHDRSPLEHLSLFELEKLPRDQTKTLLPAANPEDWKAVSDLVKLWQNEGHAEQNLIPTFQKIYRDHVVMPIPEKEGRWDSALARLQHAKFGVGQSVVDEATGEIYPVGYHFWFEKRDVVDLALFDRAMGEIRQRRFDAESRNERRKRDENGLKKLRSSWTPRVVLMGPGVEGVEKDLERRVAILREQDFCRALAEGALGEDLLRIARAQLKLTAISPFQTSGPLPPGSRFFFGRQEEMNFIESNLRRASILIVGSRRVGKTSLLNQVRAWARKEPDLEPIYVDLQSVKTEEGFHQALTVALSDIETSQEVKKLAGGVESLRELVRKVQKLGRVPVFLFNEIDGLATHRMVGDWRALNEERRARFIMVGYSAVAELGKVDGPFFHFTVGTSFGGRAIAPTALSPEAARSLLGVLQGKELGLRWASLEEEKQGVKLLLERSYRIPWVLQHFGHLLLQRLEDDRRGILTLGDVEDLLAKHGDVVWLFIDNLDYESLDAEGSAGSRRPGYQLVLFCLARNRYFLGDESLIHDPRLRDRPALDSRLTFTVDEARDVVKETISELLDADEYALVQGYFDRLQLHKALRLLTLTLALEADPTEADRYGFLMHILPLELQRRYGRKDPTLDGLIVDTAVKFLRFLQ